MTKVSVKDEKGEWKLVNLDDEHHNMTGGHDDRKDAAKGEGRGSHQHD